MLEFEKGRFSNETAFLFVLFFGVFYLILIFALLDTKAGL